MSLYTAMITVFGLCLFVLLVILHFSWQKFIEEQDKCRYCIKKFPLVDSKDLEIRLVYGNQMIVKSQGKDTAVPIRYCPMCGRKLK